MAGAHLAVSSAPGPPARWCGCRGGPGGPPPWRRAGDRTRDGRADRWRGPPDAV